LFLAPLLGLQAVACSHPDARFALDVNTQAIAVPASRALVVPPSGGPPIVGVTETSFANAIVQSIVLGIRSATPGQNEFVVQAFRASPPGEAELGTLADSSLSPFALSRELEDRFPGIEMQIGQAYTQNKYGPFGYAGRRGSLPLRMAAHRENQQVAAQSGRRRGFHPPAALRHGQLGGRTAALVLRLHLHRGKPSLWLGPVRRAARPFVSLGRDKLSHLPGCATCY
jgi:hypothetical protein